MTAVKERTGQPFSLLLLYHKRICQYDEITVKKEYTLFSDLFIYLHNKLHIILYMKVITLLIEVDSCI